MTLTAETARRKALAKRREAAKLRAKRRAEAKERQREVAARKAKRLAHHAKRKRELKALEIEIARTIRSIKREAIQAAILRKSGIAVDDQDLMLAWEWLEEQRFSISITFWLATVDVAKRAEIRERMSFAYAAIKSAIDDVISGFKHTDRPKFVGFLWDKYKRFQRHSNDESLFQFLSEIYGELEQIADHDDFNLSLISVFSRLRRRIREICGIDFAKVASDPDVNQIGWAKDKSRRQRREPVMASMLAWLAGRNGQRFLADLLRVIEKRAEAGKVTAVFEVWEGRRATYVRMGGRDTKSIPHGSMLIDVMGALGYGVKMVNHKCNAARQMAAIGPILAQYDVRVVW